MTTERPVPSGEIPENFTLNQQQKQQVPPPIPYLLNFGVYLTSGILPSGQENFNDENQYPQINEAYPSPINVNGTFAGTGLLMTYPPWWVYQNPTGYPPELRNQFGVMKQSGILHYKDLIGNFSNVSGVSGIAVQDFNIFNSYIHYYPINTEITNQNKGSDSPVLIPYVSDYEVVSNPINPY